MKHFEVQWKYTNEDWRLDVNHLDLHNYFQKLHLTAKKTPMKLNYENIMKNFVAEIQFESEPPRRIIQFNVNSYTKNSFVFKFQLTSLKN